PVADAIADHYKPLGPNDICPTLPDSIVVALADKLDALAAFFAIGEKPTGSRDPFALRRAALGTIRLILENKVRIGLAASIANHLSLLHEGGIKLSQFISHDVLEFIADRLKVHLRAEGIRHDLIAAVFALNEDDLVRLIARVDSLSNFLSTEDGANLLTAYRRASNIVTIEEGKGGWSEGEIIAERLNQLEERQLEARLREVRRNVDHALADENFEGAMAALATLRGPVDEFFDKVTVNVEDRALRENRLRLLSRIRAVMNQVADFSQIEG